MHEKVRPEGPCGQQKADSGGDSDAETLRRRATRGFGPVDAGTITRTASLVAVLSAFGVQSVTNGFLWGLLTQKAPVEAATPEAAPAQV
jgi:hypothetical protein